MTRVILWTLAVMVPLMVWYVLWGRSWLKSKPGMQWLYKSTVGEWTEVNLFSKSESVLWGRTLQFIGYVLTAIAGLGGIDLTPIALVLPERLRWIVPVMPLVISVAGHIQVKLRKDTTLPLEVVALPGAAMTPAVTTAVHNLETVKVEAVAVVAAEAEAAKVP